MNVYHCFCTLNTLKKGQMFAIIEMWPHLTWKVKNFSNVVLSAVIQCLQYQAKCKEKQSERKKGRLTKWLTQQWISAEYPISSTPKNCFKTKQVSLLSGSDWRGTKYCFSCSSNWCSLQTAAHKVLFLWQTENYEG